MTQPSIDSLPEGSEPELLTTEDVKDLIRPPLLICPHCGDICRSKPHYDNHVESCSSKPINPVGRPPKQPQPQQPAPPALPPTKPLDRLLEKLVDKDK